MKKKFNENAIENELREGSAFFSNKQSSLETEPETELTVDVDEKQALEKKEEKRTYVRTSVRTDGRPPEQDRIKIRHAFNIYADQLHALQKVQLEAVKSETKKPTLAEMVSEAIDMYLDKLEKEK